MQDIWKNVLVVDDHPIVLQAVKNAIEHNGTRDSDAAGSTERIRVSTASNGQEALSAYQALRPDLVLCDISLNASMSGIELTKRLVAQDDQAVVVMFTSHADDEAITAAIDAGANGYITKGTAPDDLVVHIFDAMDGDAVYDKVVTRHVHRLLRNRDQAPRASFLSPREHEVLLLLCQEVCNNQDIADALFISLHTCRSHLDSLYRKLGVSSKPAAVAKAWRTGLVSLATLGAESASSMGMEMLAGAS